MVRITNSNTKKYNPFSLTIEDLFVILRHMWTILFFSANLEVKVGSSGIIGAKDLRE